MLEVTKKCADEFKVTNVVRDTFWLWRQGSTTAARWNAPMALCSRSSCRRKPSDLRRLRRRTCPAATVNTCSALPRQPDGKVSRAPPLVRSFDRCRRTEPDGARSARQAAAPRKCYDDVY